MTTAARPHRPIWAEHIGHPIALAAVAVLAVNDHLLKGSRLVPTCVTGKLSDVAGLFFFPLLLSAAVRGARRLLVHDESDHPLIALASIGATALTFSALKTVPTFNRFVSAILGPNVLDVTDLWAMLALVPSWLWMCRRSRPVLPNWLHVGAVVASGVAGLATSRARGEYVRNYPAWTIQGSHTHAIACGNIDAWVLKSGKQGAGIVLEVTASNSDCRVELQNAQLVLKGVKVPMASPGATALAAPGMPRDLYLPFAFDGDAAWNRGDHDAELRLTMLVGDKADTWTVRLMEKFDGGLYVFRREEPPPR